MKDIRGWAMTTARAAVGIGVAVVLSLLVAGHAARREFSLRGGGPPPEAPIRSSGDALDRGEAATARLAWRDVEVATRALRLAGGPLEAAQE